MIVGLNESLFKHSQDMFCFSTESTFIGTMVEEILYKEAFGTYRVPMSQSEYKQLFHTDNADVIIIPSGREMGLVDDNRWKLLSDEMQTVDEKLKRMQKMLFKKAVRR